MSILETHCLAKRFGKVHALQSLTLTFSKGVSGLLGPNGAGKTTTIGVLLGLLKPDGGKATVLSFDCWRESLEIRKRLGVLHEKPVYPGGFTGRRYLEYVARFYGVSKPKEQAARLLKSVGFSAAADRNIGTYSAGMVQRIGLAQALIGEPELAILDEPTANLDPIGRVAFLERIRQLNREEGISFIISTHVLGELETVCDQVAVIDRGVVREHGRVEELARKYVAREYAIVVSKPEILAGELDEAGFAGKFRVEPGGTVVVDAHDLHRLQDEVIRIVQKHSLELIAMSPRYGVLEAVYRRAMEEKENA
jgi:ABC-2 type transport system ATP-binding protein